MNEKAQYCSFMRRIAAIFYDALILFSILCIVTLIILLFNMGEAIESDNILYKLSIVTILYFYFCKQWVIGQTLGMRCWHIHILSADDKKLTWKNASLRFLVAIFSWLLFGFGYIYILFNKNRCSLHDRLLKTKLIKKKS